VPSSDAAVRARFRQDLDASIDGFFVKRKNALSVRV
jgi:hypothetical protein